MKQKLKVSARARINKRQLLVLLKVMEEQRDHYREQLHTAQSKAAEETKSRRLAVKRVVEVSKQLEAVRKENNEKYLRIGDLEQGINLARDYVRYASRIDSGPIRNVIAWKLLALARVDDDEERKRKIDAITQRTWSVEIISSKGERDE